MIDYDDDLNKEEYKEQTRENFEWLKNNATKNKVIVKEWYYLTDDEDSYPETFKFVLVEDDAHDKNIAYCDPDYDWYINNGEDSLKLIGKVVRWAYVD